MGFNLENVMEDLIMLPRWPVYVPATGDPAHHLARQINKPELIEDIRTMIEQNLITVGSPESDYLNGDCRRGPMVRKCQLTADR